MAATNQEIFATAVSDMLRSSILPAISEWLGTKNVSVSVADLAEVLNLPSSRAVPGAAVRSAPRTAAKTRRPSVALDPVAKCEYVFQRGKHQQSVCGNPAELGKHHCPDCMTKEGVKKLYSTTTPAQEVVASSSGAPTRPTVSMPSVPAGAAGKLTQTKLKPVINTLEDRISSISRPPEAVKFNVSVISGLDGYFVSVPNDGEKMFMVEGGQNKVVLVGIVEPDNITRSGNNVVFTRNVLSTMTSADKAYMLTRYNLKSDGGNLPPGFAFVEEGAEAEADGETSEEAVSLPAATVAVVAANGHGSETVEEVEEEVEEPEETEEDEPAPVVMVTPANLPKGKATFVPPSGPSAPAKVATFQPPVGVPASRGVPSSVKIMKTRPVAE